MNNNCLHFYFFKRTRFPAPPSPTHIKFPLSRPTPVCTLNILSLSLFSILLIFVIVLLNTGSLLLTLAGIFHTRGETPRHFQFDRSGQWLIVANQDSDDCAVFNFNCSTGQLTYTNNSFKCPSPNFVCVWDGA